ncbi:MAG: hypothetical protein PW788_09470 [Micavibrio sp.]|nr:hypothetical protein [Micavibrio sp.]
MDSKQLCAAFAILLMLCSRGAYFSSILKGRTKPHSFSWLIWAVISSIGFAAQVAEHAGPGSWVRGVSSFTCYIIVVFGWLKGERNITRSDKITLLAALSAIPLWLLTETPVWSVILVCLIDTSGYLPTMRKVWTKPQQETPVGYIFSAFGAAFSLLAIENYNLSTWLYPFVLVCSNTLMAGYILLLRRRAILPGGLPA